MHLVLAEFASIVRVSFVVRILDELQVLGAGVDGLRRLGVVVDLPRVSTLSDLPRDTSEQLVQSSSTLRVERGRKLGDVAGEVVRAVIGERRLRRSRQSAEATLATAVTSES